MKLCQKSLYSACYDASTVDVSEAAVETAETEAEEVERVTRRTVLETAIKTICQDRQDQYGNPENNFQTIADMWTTYLRAAEVISPTTDAVIMPHDVAAMMCMLKLARVATGAAKLDNWVDLAGYAALGGEMEQ